MNPDIFETDAAKLDLLDIINRFLTPKQRRAIREEAERQVHAFEGENEASKLWVPRKKLVLEICKATIKPCGVLQMH